MQALAVSALAFVATLVSAPLARAQSGYFYLDRAQISGAPDDGFMVFRPYVPGENRIYANAALGYSHNTLRSDTVTRNANVERRIDDPVGGQFITYLSGGAQLLQRVTVSFTLPITLLNLYGDDPQSQRVGVGGIGDDPISVGDLRLDARVKTWEADDGGLRFALGAAAYAPTGNRNAFSGDGKAGGYLYVASELDFKKFFLSGNLGPQFRPERSIGGENGGLFIGSELRWAFGAYLPLRENRIRLGGELWGTTGLGSGDPQDRATFFGLRNTALEWLAQARFTLNPRQRLYAQAGAGTRLSAGYGAADFRILGSIGIYTTLNDLKAKSPPRRVTVVADVDDYDRDTDGDGYPDSVDKCPSEKEDGKPPNSTDGCPGNSDRDGDGIPDSVDQCPDKKEDKDGIQDEDGCPEDDADSDGIPDVQDKCPTEPGIRTTVAEKFGCPSLTRLNESGEVELLQPIEFETGRAAIKAGSFPILDEVVALMKSRGNLRMGVYGHTDNRGIAPKNLQLSRERAGAVRKYLEDKGIAGSRLESNGFGQTKPIAPNDTDQGRAKNRRVEFKVLGASD